MTLINHPLWFPVSESLVSFPKPWIIPYRAPARRSRGRVTKDFQKLGPQIWLMPVIEANGWRNEAWHVCPGTYLFGIPSLRQNKWDPLLCSQDSERWDLLRSFGSFCSWTTLWRLSRVSSPRQRAPPGLPDGLLPSNTLNR